MLKLSDLINVFALQFDVAKDFFDKVALPSALKVALVINALPPDTPPVPPPEADVVVLVPLDMVMHFVTHDAINSGALAFASDCTAGVDSELLQDCRRIDVAIDSGSYFFTMFHYRFSLFVLFAVSASG